MNLDRYITKLDKLLRHKFSKDSCHDIYHLYRVYYLSLSIQKKEGGDRLIIGVAAFLHDIHRMIESETGRFCDPKKSLPKVRLLLNKISFPKEKIIKVLHVIEYHEQYSFTKEGKTVNDVETLIVQDADNLDAMGAIGIGRTFVFSALLRKPMWNPSIGFNRRFYAEDKSDPSTIHHFRSKLLKLKNNMNTNTAKKLALHRHNYMKNFVNEFMSEWHGKL